MIDWKKHNGFTGVAQSVNFATEEVSKWEVQRYAKHAGKKNNT